MKFKAAAIQNEDNLMSRPSDLLGKVALMGMPLSDECYKDKVKRSLCHLQYKLGFKHLPGNRKSWGCLQKATDSFKKENIEEQFTEDTVYLSGDNYIDRIYQVKKCENSTNYS